MVGREVLADVIDQLVMRSGHGGLKLKLFVGVEVDVLGMEEHLLEEGFELVVEFDVLDGGDFCGLLWSVRFSFPDTHVFVGVGDEEHLSPFGFWGIGEEDEGCGLAVDAAEHEEVGILAEGIALIAVARHAGIGVEDGDAVGLHGCGQCCAFFLKQGTWNGAVSMHRAGQFCREDREFGRAQGQGMKW